MPRHEPSVKQTTVFPVDSGDRLPHGLFVLLFGFAFKSLWLPLWFYIRIDNIIDFGAINRHLGLNSGSLPTLTQKHIVHIALGPYIFPFTLYFFPHLLLPVPQERTLLSMQKTHINSG